MIFIFKNKDNTLEGVLKYSKHATLGVPRNITEGDIILIAQTKDSLLPGQKQIRWIMNYVESYIDEKNESEKIWGKKWKYIIKGKNLRGIEPFNIEDLKVSDKNYNAIQTFGELHPDDEKKVLEWIGEEVIDKDEEEIFQEFEEKKQLNYKELIQKFDEKYSGKPLYKKKIMKYIHRPSCLRNAILKERGYTCNICGYEGFEKKNGGKYAETHHMKELNEEAPGTLQSWNVIIVCPTCHKKLHYGKVKNEYLNPGWKIYLDNKEIIIK